MFHEGTINTLPDDGGVKVFVSTFCCCGVLYLFFILFTIITTVTAGIIALHMRDQYHKERSISEYDKRDNPTISSSNFLGSNLVD